MGGKPRGKTPEDIAAQVMFDSDRTCCVCRETRKEVQIHHIDEDPSNNSPENLAVLCFEHHDETQRKGGFGRKLDATQVRLYRADWHKRVAQRRDRLVALNEEQFQGFHPDIVQSPSSEDEREEGSFTSLERERVGEYQKNHGLFIVHYWRPSDDSEQVADIVIRLHQHNLGPLNEGKIESVEYQLGPKFFTEPMIIADASNDFELEVSAYRPMLCLAKVRFNDGRPLITLFRYIDFPVEG
jgi:hypothetical protein